MIANRSLTFIVQLVGERTESGTRSCRCLVEGSLDGGGLGERFGGKMREGNLVLYGTTMPTGDAGSARVVPCQYNSSSRLNFTEASHRGIWSTRSKYGRI